MTADLDAVAAWRAEVRGWFERHSSPRVGAVAIGRGVDVARSRAWQRRLFAAGLTGVDWPTRYGGGGRAAWQAAVVREEAARFADTADDVFGTGVGLVGPALLAHGTEAQRDAHLRAILAGDAVWCQLFSEPDAGSDLASLTTRADRDGDGWVVNGGKVWSSGAHLADFGLLLARTDPAQPGRRGISAFLLPMRLPGVAVHPLRQMTGDAHFCQVFLTDVRLPGDALLGEPEGGWAVTGTVLAQERYLVAAGAGVDLPVDRLAALGRDGGRDGGALGRDGGGALGRDGGPPLAGTRRDRVVQAVIRARLVGLLADRLLGDAGSPAFASVCKLAMADHVARTADLAMELLGPAAALGADRLAPADASWQDAFLGQWLIRLGGGTEQIQRTIVADRLLGLPPG